MDISNFDVNEQALPLILVNPKTGEDLINEEKEPMTIYLYGLDSSVGETAAKEIKSSNRKGKVLSDAEIKKNTINLMARCTSQFKGLVLDGKVLECSHESATNLYKNYNWIFDQVGDFVGTRANHLGNSQSD